MRKLLLTLPVLLALAYPSGAGAMIQIDRGIAGVRLNNTQAEVRAALGKPRRAKNGKNAFGPFTRFVYRGGITVLFQGRKKVTSVTTTGLGDRTANGIGVGSTEQAVDSQLPAVQCESFGPSRSCHTGEFTPGQRVTDFMIRNGKVFRITVGFVID